MKIFYDDLFVPSSIFEFSSEAKQEKGKQNNQ